MEFTVHECEAEATNLHAVLANRRRRQVLEVLDEVGAPVTLADLATEIARREASTRGVDADAIERIRASLYHHHAPMMADRGVVEYDPEHRTVAPSDPDRSFRTEA